MVYRTLGTPLESCAVTATGSFQTDGFSLCVTTGTDLVINILSSRKSLSASLSLAVPLPGVATADGDASLRRIFFNRREKATRDGNHFPGKFPGGRKRRESFLNHPFPVRSRRSGASVAIEVN